MMQGEDEGPGDILDEELQKQLNEIADYDSDDAIQPASATGETHSVTCSLRLSFYCSHRRFVPCASMPELRMLVLGLLGCLNFCVA